jgi:hypothetical protein
MLFLMQKTTFCYVKNGPKRSLLLLHRDRGSAGQFLHTYTGCQVTHGIQETIWGGAIFTEIYDK